MMESDIKEFRFVTFNKCVVFGKIQRVCEPSRLAT